MIDPVRVPHAGAVLATEGPVLTVRLTFLYEADVAGGSAGQFAAEINPSLHVFATHGLGVLNHTSDDDGVVVVSTADVVKQSGASPSGASPRTPDSDEKQPVPLVVEIPFNPAAAQYAKLDQDRLWALPGGQSAVGYRLPNAQGQWPVPADASISFNAYAQTATQHGQVCRTRAGEALFLLSELFGRDWSKEDAKAEWQVTGDEPLVKGFVVVQRAELVSRSSGKSAAEDT